MTKGNSQVGFIHVDELWLHSRLVCCLSCWQDQGCYSWRWKSRLLWMELKENSLGRGIMSFSSHWELLLGVNVITRVPVGCFTPRCTASAAEDEPSCLSAWICPYSSRVGIVAGVRAELCMPVCAFLAPFGSRVVAFPGHFWSVHRTLTDLSLCLHYQHGLKQVFFLQDVRVRRVSKLLYTACCNSLPPPTPFFKKKIIYFPWMHWAASCAN